MTEEMVVGGRWEVQGTESGTWWHVVQLDTDAIILSTADQALAHWVADSLNGGAPAVARRTTKLERLRMIVDYAKRLGFDKASEVWWDVRCEEIGAASPFEQPDPNEPLRHDMGVALNDSVVALWLCPDGAEDWRLLCDTMADAHALLVQHGLVPPGPPDPPGIRDGRDVS